MPRKALEPWQVVAARNLKKLYKARATLTQTAFGVKYDIGTQGMVWQYLNGKTPLGLEPAIKFAAALKCSLSDIHPELERQREALGAGVAGIDILAGLNEADRKNAIEHIETLRQAAENRARKGGRKANG